MQKLFCGGGLQGSRCQHLGVIFVREKLQKDHSNVTHIHVYISYCTSSFCVWKGGGNDSGYEGYDRVTWHKGLDPGSFLQKKEPGMILLCLYHGGRGHQKSRQCNIQ